MAMHDPLTGYEPNLLDNFDYSETSAAISHRESCDIDTEPSYSCDAELDDETIGKALSSPLFIQEFGSSSSSPFHKHLRNVLQQPPLVQQSHTTLLILALSISSLFSSVRETGHDTSLCTNPCSRSTPILNTHYQIFSGCLPGCHSQNRLRSFKIGSHLCNISGIKLTGVLAVFIWSFSSDYSRNTTRIISIGFRMFTFHNVVCIS